ncbi:MAG: WG repeat-containing protein [Prevotella sp.]|nr:WG repeat-containing protein [Prevotella sp.]
MVISSSGEWKHGRPFSEGLAWVQDGNRKYGCIDRAGKLVVPFKWRWAYDFREGLAGVHDEYRHYGFIDKTGKVVIPVKWKEMLNWTEIDYGFSGGVAWVVDANNDRYHIISNKGHIVK